MHAATAQGTPPVCYLGFMAVLARVSRVFVSDRFVMTVIVLNTVALFLFETFPSQSPWSRLWYAIDYVCVAFFLLEAIIKITSNGWLIYWSSGWNKFDFVVVLLSTPVLFVPPTDEMQIFANFLVLRLGRLFRLFRVLRFIPNMDHLVAGVRRALRASVGVFLALFLFNFILAMAATVTLRGIDPEHFGTPFRSGYALFKVFTVEGWYEVPDELAEQIRSGDLGENGKNLNPIATEVGVRVFFVLTVLVGGILGLSLANAVFVDEMMADNTHALERKVEALTARIEQLTRELGGRDPP
ncbi:MAG: ion transporter [bacterium]|nr:ion transporter [bacterium]